ncbi:unnamed protein product [Notodromas monacha]|uniref:KASH domain-containing protein n=1 Tax=Notodromas monacha TaxID=399045 RepID=A0A7R9BC54_9CRUS|nr:unnamed protein product [Notodromas monacha]CAG0912566.1 unnamed protein product [Notodromas monacha]
MASVYHGAPRVYPSPSDWTVSEFMAEYDNLSRWLADIYGAIFGNECKLAPESVRLTEAVALSQQASRRDTFVLQGKNLLVTHPKHREEVQLRLDQLQSKWDTLDQTLNPPSGSKRLPTRNLPLEKDPSVQVKHLRDWLINMEDKLRVMSKSLMGESLNALEQKLRHHAVIQASIQSQGTAISALLKLCEASPEIKSTPPRDYADDSITESLDGEEMLLFQRPMSPKDISAYRLAATTLEHRWHRLWLESLELQCVLEERIMKMNKGGPPSHRWSGSDRDEEPVTKYPRLFVEDQGSQCSDQPENDEDDDVSVEVDFMEDVFEVTKQVDNDAKNQRNGVYSTEKPAVEEHPVDVLSDGIQKDSVQIDNSPGELCGALWTGPNSASFHYKVPEAKGDDNTKVCPVLPSQRSDRFTNAPGPKLVARVSPQRRLQLDVSFDEEDLKAAARKMEKDWWLASSSDSDWLNTEGLSDSDGSGWGCEEPVKHAGDEDIQPPKIPRVKPDGSKRPHRACSKHSIHRLVNAAEEMVRQEGASFMVVPSSVVRPTRGLILRMGTSGRDSAGNKADRIAAWLASQPAEARVNHPLDIIVKPGTLNDSQVTDSCDASGEYTTDDSPSEHSDSESEGRNSSVATCQAQHNVLVRVGDSDLDTPVVEWLPSFSVLSGAESSLKTPTREKKPAFVDAPASDNKRVQKASKESSLKLPLERSWKSRSEGCLDPDSANVCKKCKNRGVHVKLVKRRKKQDLSNSRRKYSSSSSSRLRHGSCSISTPELSVRHRIRVLKSPGHARRDLITLATPSRIKDECRARGKRQRGSLQKSKSFSGREKMRMCEDDDVNGAAETWPGHGSSPELVDILPALTLERDAGIEAALSHVEETSSMSEQAWDPYQVPVFIDENYSESGMDPEAVRKLLDWDDYRNFLDSLSDATSSAAPRRRRGNGSGEKCPPRSTRKKKKSRSSQSSEASKESDSEDDHRLVRKASALLLAAASSQDSRASVDPCATTSINCQIIEGNEEVFFQSSENGGTSLSADNEDADETLNFEAIDKLDSTQNSTGVVQCEEKLEIDQQMDSLKHEMIGFELQLKSILFDKDVENPSDLKQLIILLQAFLREMGNQKHRLLDVNIVVHSVVTTASEQGCASDDKKNQWKNLVDVVYQQWDDLEQSAMNWLLRLQRASEDWHVWERTFSAVESHLASGLGHTKTNVGVNRTDDPRTDPGKLVTIVPERVEVGKSGGGTAAFGVLLGLEKDDGEARLTAAGVDMVAQVSSESNLLQQKGVGMAGTLRDCEDKLLSLNHLSAQIAAALPGGPKAALKFVEETFRIGVTVQELRHSFEDVKVVNNVGSENIRVQGVRGLQAAEISISEKRERRKRTGLLLFSSVLFQVSILFLLCVAFLIEPHCCDAGARKWRWCSLDTLLSYEDGRPPS